MKKLTALLLALVMVLSLAACGGSGSSQGSTGENNAPADAPVKDTLNYALFADPAGLDPQNISDGVAAQVMSAAVVIREENDLTI